jgi:biopolymer transport protein ExbD
MPIRKPSKVLLRTIPLKFVAKKVQGGGNKAVNHDIPLIPFIDFLIVLVVFLLSSFSATGELMAQKPNLKMPTAINATMLEISPIISVDTVVVTLEGHRIADTQTLAQDPKMDRIEALVENLDTLRRNWSMLHPQEPFPGMVILQADVGIDYRVIKKLMFSAAQAGYANVSFAVNRRAGGKAQ